MRMPTELPVALDHSWSGGPIFVRRAAASPLALRCAKADSPTTRLGGGMAMARLTVNDKSVEVNVNPSTPLLWVIREQVGLTGTKYGCGIAQCGACTVHLDGVAIRSCVIPVSAAEGKQVTTIEGLAANGVLHKVQKAWLESEV